MGAKGVPEVHSCGELFNFNLCFCDCYCTILHYEAGKLSVSIIVFLRHTSVGNYAIFHIQGFEPVCLPVFPSMLHLKVLIFGKWLWFMAFPLSEAFAHICKPTACQMAKKDI